MSKCCSNCKETKPFVDFYKKTNSYSSYCKLCHSIKSKQYYLNNSDYIKKKTNDWKKNNRDKKLATDKIYRQKNPHFFKEYRQKNKLKFKGYAIKKKYNITISDYEKMESDQNNKCLICSIDQSKYSMYVDHCHKTGKVRGLLCHYCNTGLGLFKDNINFLYNAIKYLGGNT